MRQFGGVLEHPAGSLLWKKAGLPPPGQVDRYGGWTLPIHQNWWGHQGEKATLLYGCAPADVPPIPMRLGEATLVVQSRKRTDHRPHITKAEREHTPPELAQWLCELARRCAISRPPQWRGRLPEHLEASCSRIHSSNASRIALQ